jgi:hypothetical protein
MSKHKSSIATKISLFLIATVPLMMAGDCDGDEADGVYAIIEGIIGLVLGILSLT